MREQPEQEEEELGPGAERDDAGRTPKRAKKSKEAKGSNLHSSPESQGPKTSAQANPEPAAKTEAPKDASAATDKNAPVDSTHQKQSTSRPVDKGTNGTAKIAVKLDSRRPTVASSAQHSAGKAPVVDLTAESSNSSSQAVVIYSEEAPAAGASQNAAESTPSSSQSASASKLPKRVAAAAASAAAVDVEGQTSQPSTPSSKRVEKGSAVSSPSSAQESTRKKAKTDASKPPPTSATPTACSSSPTSSSSHADTAIASTGTPADSVKSDEAVVFKTVFVLLAPEAAVNMAKEGGGGFVVVFVGEDGKPILDKNGKPWQLPVAHVHSTLWATPPVTIGQPKESNRDLRRYQYVFTTRKPRDDQLFERSVRTLRIGQPFQFDECFDHPKKELNMEANAGPRHPFELYLRHLVFLSAPRLQKLCEHHNALAAEPKSTLRSCVYDVLLSQFSSDRKLGQKWVSSMNNFLREQSGAYQQHKQPSLCPGGALLLSQLFHEIHQLQERVTGLSKSGDRRALALHLLNLLAVRCRGQSEVSEREKRIVGSSIPALLSAAQAGSAADSVSWMGIMSSASDLAAKFAIDVVPAVLQSVTKRPVKPPPAQEAGSAHARFVESATLLSSSLSTFPTDTLTSVCRAAFLTAPGLPALVKALASWWPAISAALPDAVQHVEALLETLRSLDSIPSLAASFALASVEEAGALAALLQELPAALRPTFLPVFRSNVQEMIRGLREKERLQKCFRVLLHVITDPACEPCVADEELCSAIQVMVQNGEATTLYMEMPAVFKRAFTAIRGSLVGDLEHHAKFFIRRCFCADASILRFIAENYGGPLCGFVTLSSFPSAIVQDAALLQDLWDSCRKAHRAADILAAARKLRGQKLCKEARKQIIDGCTALLKDAAESQETALSALSALGIDKEPDSLCDALAAELVGAIAGFDFRGDSTVPALLRARNFWLPLLLQRRPPLSQARQLQDADSLLNRLHTDLSERTLTIGSLTSICDAFGPDVIRECLAAVGADVGASVLEDYVALVRSTDSRLQRLLASCAAWQSLTLAEPHKASLDSLSERLMSERADIRQQSIAQLSHKNAESLLSFDGLLRALDALGDRIDDLLRSPVFRTFLQQPPADSQSSLADLLPSLTLDAVQAYKSFTAQLFASMQLMQVADIIRHWDVVGQQLQRRSERETSLVEQITNELELAATIANLDADVEALAADIKFCIDAQLLEELAPHIASCIESFMVTPKDSEQRMLTWWGGNPITAATCTVRDAIQQQKLWKRKLGIPTEGAAAVLRELGDEDGEGRKLIEFLRKVGPDHEALQHLKDAVDEQSDMQFRTATDTVQDLAEVRSFLYSILYGDKKTQTKYTGKVSRFLDFIETRMREQKAGIAIANNVVTCREQIDALKRLYENVANRGEVTKGIVRDAVQHGKYVFSCDAEGARLVLEIRDDEGDRLEALDASYNYQEVQEFRSRAIVIRSSRIRAVSAPQEAEAAAFAAANDLSVDDLNTFIDDSTIAGDALGILVDLHVSADSRYKSWSQEAKGSAQLKEVRDSLRRAREESLEQLRVARSRHYGLLFLVTRQIWGIVEFLQSEYDDAIALRVCSTLRLYLPSITTQAIQDAWQQNPVDTADLEACFRGVAQLVGLCEKSCPLSQPLPFPRSTAIRASDKVERLRVIAVDSPKHVVNVLFSLCMTDGRLPARSQILFCSPSTTLEELQLLVDRCRLAEEREFKGRLFYILHAELLQYELQVILSGVLREMEKDAHLHPFRLAVVCCRHGSASEQSQLLSDFAATVHPTNGLQDGVVREVAAELLPHALVVTSEGAGLGKTEYVALGCLKRDLEPRILTVTGVFDPPLLVQRIEALDLQPGQHALHIDVGSVDAPHTLDLFLLELLLLRTVCVGDEVFIMPDVPVFVEVGSVAGAPLISELAFCRQLAARHLQWSIDRVVVSLEPSSVDQLVCRYLQALDLGTLETEDIAVNQAGLQAISLVDCRELLSKHFFKHARVAPRSPYAALRTFLRVLGYQLVRLSRSPFFRVANLRYAMRQTVRGTRERLVRSLVDMASEFASLHDPAQRRAAAAAGSDSIDYCVDRFSRMVQWSAAENNHLFVLFHPSGSLTALYRNPGTVPRPVRSLLESQSSRAALTDFSALPPSGLLEHLLRLFESPASMDALRDDPYVMTTDNLLKMALILTRVRARVPVVIMGETGCGKTSLVRFLARVARVEFLVLNFHAGVAERDVEAIVAEAEQKAEGEAPVWVFLDEINTSACLGLVSEVVCRHTLHGRPLARSISFLAACNPYKRRSPEELARQAQAGLRLKQRDDPMSRLVYRVHPLPERLADFVWDFGALSREDEARYVHAMVRGSEFVQGLRGVKAVSEHQVLRTAKVVTGLLCASQDFMARGDALAVVSLRDVNRCIFLMAKFLDLLRRKDELDEEKSSGKRKSSSKPKKRRRRRTGGDALEEHPLSKPWADLPTRAIVMALAHCYLCRLPTSKLRTNYLSVLSEGLRALSAECSPKLLADVIRWEQMDLLWRMTLPPGTAMNEALVENVFVLLVCIIHCIPVFLVGKPGCSKTLSMRLITSNLRGPNSRDPFFRTLPQLSVYPYQGSEQSNSEGIQKVFEKAKQERKRAAEWHTHTMPVVLLDEVGLAEVSRFNPLKVLHALLEPGYPQIFPDVAVVGISNWQLDPAKMNRAIHLSRPEPDVGDLFDTARAIIQTEVEGRSGFLDDPKLRLLAIAYCDYQKDMKHGPFENFHGLRDYYSLVKSLARADLSGGEDLLAVVSKALQRNFSGLSAVAPPERAGRVLPEFLESMKLIDKGAPASVPRLPVLELIRENWLDTEARHLLVASGCDATMGILQRELAPVLAARGRSLAVVVGSCFPDDAGSDEYAYRVLSRIILSMEAGNCVILKDLNVYGALYDMLNQHYTAGAGNKRYCRVALGAFTSPPCHVDDLFRCIVVVDREEVEHQDPPFLNRFEKQVVSYEDILTSEQRSLARELERWVRDAAACTAPGSSFVEGRPELSFCGFNEDTLPSLARLHLPGADREAALAACKADLVSTMTEDCRARLRLSRLGVSDEAEAMRAAEGYDAEAAMHGSLAAFVERAIAGWRERPDVWGGPAGVTAVVYTFSQPTPSPPVGGRRADSVVLGAIRREADFTARMKAFWSADSADELLVVQCAAALDRPTLPLALSLLEECREAYAKAADAPSKHALFLVHLERTAPASAGFSHLGQWRQVTVDAVEPAAADPRPLSGRPVAGLLASGQLDDLFLEVLPWAFSALRYRNAGEVEEHVRGAQAGIRASPDARAFLQSLVAPALRASDAGDADWAQRVACSLDALALSTSLGAALLEALRKQLRGPLAAALLRLEREELLPSLLARPKDVAALYAGPAARLAPELADLAGLPPASVEGYAVPGPMPRRLVPFSRALHRRLEEYKEGFAQRLAALRARAEDGAGGESDSDDAVAAACCEELRATLPAELIAAAGAVAGDRADDYARDFALSVAAELEGFASVGEARDAAFWLLRAAHAAPFPDAVAVHAAWWAASAQFRPCLALLAACAKVVPVADAASGAVEGGAGGVRVHVADRLCRAILAAVASADGGDGPWLPAARHAVAQVSAGGPFEVPPTPAFQLLRLCTELAPCFCNASDREARGSHAELLAALVALGEGAGPEPLASAPFVAGLLSLLDRHAAALDAAAVDRLEATLFARCLGPIDRPSAAAPLLELIVKRLLRPGARHGPGAAHVLGTLLSLASEEHGDSPLGLFGEALLAPGLLAASPPLAALAAALAAHPVDGPAFAFVSDVLLLKVYARVRPADCAAGSFAEKAVAECLAGACRVLDDAGAAPLATAAAAAFVRAACTAVAPYWVPASTLHNLSPHIERAFDAALAGPSDRLHGARLCLLRALRRAAGPVPVGDLRAWCTQSLARRLGWLAALPWRPSLASRLDYDPFQNADGFDAARAALDAHLAGGGGGGDLERLLGEAARRPAALRAVAQAFLARFFLARAAAEAGPPPPDAAASSLPAMIDGLLGHARLAASRLLKAFLPGFARPDGACAPPRSFLELAPGCEAVGVHLAALFAHWAALLASAPPEALPFAAFFAGPGQVPQRFVPGAPASAEAAAARALRKAEKGEGQWYTHSCGFRYFVDRCGRPMQSAMCPNPQCAGSSSGVIGGEGHTPATGNSVAAVSEEERPGLPPADPDELRGAPQHTERGLRPAAFRLLRLLTNLALGAAAAAATVPWPPNLSAALFHDGDPSNALEAARADVEALAELFDVELPDVCLALHGILRRLAADLQSGRSPLALPRGQLATTSAANRAAFERAFEAAYVRPLVQSGARAAAAAFREECRPPAGEAAAGLEAELLDGGAGVGDGRRLPRSLAPVRAGTADGLRRAFQLRPELRDRHRALALLLDSAGEIERVQAMAPLVRWSTAAARRLEHVISRKDGQQRTVREFLAEHPALEPLFEAGRAAWEAARPSLQGAYDCVAVPPAPEATLDSPISLFLPERRDNGVHLCMAFNQVACVQNHLLHEAAALARDGCPALAFLATPGAAFGEVDVQEAAEGDLVDLEVDDALAGEFACPSLEARDAVVYDFARLEATLAQRAFAGRRLVRMDRDHAALPPFVYHLELFPTSGAILEEIDARVRQEPLPREAEGAIRRDGALKERLERAMPAMEVVLSTLHRTSGRWSEDQPLASFAALFEAGSQERWLLTLPVLRQHALRHACAVYEQLELMRCEVVIECVPEPFRAPLPAEVEAGLAAGLEGASLEDLLVALRRFIYRYYLCFAGAGGDAAELRQPLRAHLEREDLWRRPRAAPAGPPEALAARVPGSLTCAHVYALYKALRRVNERNTYGAPAPAAFAAAAAAAATSDAARISAGLAPQGPLSSLFGPQRSSSSKAKRKYT